MSHDEIRRDRTFLDGAKEMFGYRQSGQTKRSERLSGLAQTMDRRIHLRLAQMVQKTRQRLRNTPEVSRNHDPRRLRTSAPQKIPLVLDRFLEREGAFAGSDLLEGSLEGMLMLELRRLAMFVGDARPL